MSSSSKAPNHELHSQQISPQADAKIVVVPSRPEVVVLPASSPWSQIPSLATSVLALIISLYALKKNLAQKRNEHQARFFHEVVVNRGVDPLLRFYENLQGFAEKKGIALARSNGSPGHENAVREAMRSVREKKRKAATRVAGLVSPFSPELENQIHSVFDQAADAAIEWLEMHASGSVPDDQVGRKLAIYQRHTLDLLREHEFQLGWPSFWRTQWRRYFGRTGYA